MSNKGPQLKLPSEYCFAQQEDSSCHLMPYINLQLLQKMRAGSDQEQAIDLSKQAQWHTRREWFPETFNMTRSWQQAMNELHEKKGDFYKMQKSQLNDGLINGHFYWQMNSSVYGPYKQRVDNTYNPVTNQANMLLYPFNFTDANTMPEDLAWMHYHGAFKTLPLVCEQGKILCFDKEKNPMWH